MTFKGQSCVTEEEDLDLQRAIEEMKHLDEILLRMICRENEMKRQRTEFQVRLWQDFLVERIFSLLRLSPNKEWSDGVLCICSRTGLMTTVNAPVKLQTQDCFWLWRHSQVISNSLQNRSIFQQTHSSSNIGVFFLT